MNKSLLFLAVVSACSAAGSAPALAESEQSIKLANSCYASFNSGSYEEAFKNCSAAAADNDAEASNLLGAMYENGWGTDQDFSKAVDYYKKAANADLADANNNLANMYKEGKGVDADESEAHYYYEKAARLGDSNANLSLGNMVSDPKSSYYSKDQAEKYYRLSADAGNDLAQVALAKELISQNDINGALPYLEKSAEKNNPDGMELLAGFYRNGTGVRADPAKAFELYKKSADLGNKNAALETARANRDGVGTDVNFAEALKYYDKACQAKIQDAMIESGMMYLRGQGTEPDVTKGLDLLQKAASMKNLDAIRTIAELYSNGKYIPISAEKAFSYYYRCAGYGDPECETQAGIMLVKGAGTSKDVVEGVGWLVKAADEKTYVPAMLTLADVYYTSKYGYMDHEACKRYLRLAAEKGSKEASERLMQLDFE